MTKRFRLLVLALFAGAGVIAAPTAAYAVPAYPETWLPDSAGHAFCFNSSFNNFPEHRDRVRWGMNRLDDQTDMFDIEESCVSGTDIWFYRSDLPAGVRGQTQCIVWVTSGFRGDQARIDIDFIEINNGDNEVEDQQKTVVHEIGHSVGLGHHSPAEHDCAMIQGEIPSTAPVWRSFHAQDVDHINAYLV